MGIACGECREEEEVVCEVAGTHFGLGGRGGRV